MASKSGRARALPVEPRGFRARELARDFLILFAGIEVTLLVLAALVDAKLTMLATHLILVATAASVAALGLFMTLGDPGSHIRNAAKTLFVLFLLVGGVMALLLWAATGASKGS